MRSFYFSMVVFALLVGSVFAVDATSLMQQGNDFYEQGDFESAIAAYEKILKTDMTSAELYYNLGCAYFSVKEYGAAILQFEKARQLSPRDPDILHNLEYSKLFLKDRFDLPQPLVFVAWFKHIRQSLSLSELKLLEEILFGMLILGIIIYRLSISGSIRRLILPPTILSGLVFLLMSGWLLDRALSLEDKHAVLLVDEADVRSAPIPGASTLFMIHEGTSADILDATEAWYEIRLEDGKTGWIAHEAVGIY